jgi:predicted nucleotide-binding protein (sugar kinase/HSP70/actin superfamily)
MTNGKGLGILEGRKVYIPRMTYCGAKAFAAALRSVGLDADITPESDARTLELGARFLSGDECYPAKVTVGDFLRILEQAGEKLRRIAFFMPTANGPCRFGQYAWLVKKVLREIGLQDEVLVLSPNSEGGYTDLGGYAGDIMRTGWRALVASDILRKLVLKTRPYGLNGGETDRVFEDCLDPLSAVLETQGIYHPTRLGLLVDALVRARGKFRMILTTHPRSRPLIGVVGGIFCRLNTFK